MSKLTSYGEINLPIRVGIVGTGFAAKVRAQSLATESRTQLVAVAGRNPERTAEFAQSFDVLAVADWQTLVQMPDIDLVIVATINILDVENHYTPERIEVIEHHLGLLSFQAYQAAHRKI